MASKIVYDDQNSHITSNFFRFCAMISTLSIVMGLQSRQKQGPKPASTPKHTSRRGKVIEHDRSDNISHITNMEFCSSCYWQISCFFTVYP